MDGQTTPQSISPDQLFARLGAASAPLLVDVRRTEAFESDDRLIVGALRRDPEHDPQWLKGLPAGRPVVA
jgi:hypothetical protein